MYGDVADLGSYCMNLKSNVCASIDEVIELTMNDSSISDKSSVCWLEDNKKGLRDALSKAKQFLREEYGIREYQRKLFIDTKKHSKVTAYYCHKKNRVLIREKFFKYYIKDFELSVGTLVHEFVHKHNKFWTHDLTSSFSNYTKMMGDKIYKSNYKNVAFKNWLAKKFYNKFLNKMYWYKNPLGLIYKKPRFSMDLEKKIAKENKEVFKLLSNYQSAWLIREYLSEQPSIIAKIDYYSKAKGISMEEALKKCYGDKIYINYCTDLDPSLIMREPDLRYFKKLLEKGKKLIAK